MAATPTRKRLAANASRARSIRKTSLAPSRSLSSSGNRKQPSSGLVKVVTTLTGATAVSLAVALLTPSVVVTVIAMIVGLIGSGFLVKRYG
ncbi:hypothetical protein PAQ31011_02149 [Pandoraea aquatica]|uniref:Transmembrane protein n=1 Tax=Pandoraea aquatica TaxID=2508290 RepID=A0A5E4URV3_9BURK|nr:hypothetical protein PAQ31011_02149 [Pandoraea aquatica]